MIANVSATRCSSSGQFFVSRISFVKSCDPIPTQTTPALNQADKFASVGFYAAGGHELKSGHYRHYRRYDPGPNTEPGKILVIVAPWSLALTISVRVAQPGIQSVLN